MSAQSTQAHRRIAAYVKHTTLLDGGDVFYKCENLQTTGSFKLRGALSKLTSLSKTVLEQGVVTASTGNHGAAVAYASGVVGTSAVVYVPDMASPMKVRAIEDFGANVEVFGSDGVDSETEARRVAARTGRVYVSPYNDQQVIAGQATIGIELLEDLPEIEVAVVAVGGGGLVSGVASVLKTARPEVRIVGCSPENSAAMAASLEAGRVVDVEHSETISDGTHGGVEAESITFELCQELIDDFVTVSEAEIVSAMRMFIHDHNMIIEGSAGVALAAQRRLGEALSGLKTAVILCGSNISEEKLAELGDVAR